MSQRNPDTNVSLEQLRSARDKPINMQASGGIPMQPRNMQLQPKIPTGNNNAMPQRTFDRTVPAARMPMPPTQGMPGNQGLQPSQVMPTNQGVPMSMQPKISEEQMRNALKAQEHNRKQQTVNLINNQPKVHQQVQRMAPIKQQEMNNNMPKLPESVRSAMQVAMDTQQVAGKQSEEELSFFDKIKKDAKLAIIIFAVAFIVAYPAVSKLIGKYIPGMLNNEDSITFIGQIILSAIIAVLSMVAKHFM